MKTILTAALLLALNGCGGAEGDVGGFDEQEFFEQMYGDCVGFMDAYNDWQEWCGVEAARDGCVRAMWDFGITQAQCRNREWTLRNYVEVGDVDAGCGLAERQDGACPVDQDHPWVGV